MPTNKQMQPTKQTNANKQTIIQTNKQTNANKQTNTNKLIQTNESPRMSAATKHTREDVNEQMRTNAVSSHSPVYSSPKSKSEHLVNLAPSGWKGFTFEPIKIRSYLNNTHVIG